MERSKAQYMFDDRIMDSRVDFFSASWWTPRLHLHSGPQLGTMSGSRIVSAVIYFVFTNQGREVIHSRKIGHNDTFVMVTKVNLQDPSFPVVPDWVMLAPGWR